MHLYQHNFLHCDSLGFLPEKKSCTSKEKYRYIGSLEKKIVTCTFQRKTV